MYAIRSYYDRIVEIEIPGAEHPLQALAQGWRGERSGGDDHGFPVFRRQARDLAAHDRHQRLARERLRHRRAELFPVDRERAARGQPGRVAAAESYNFV